MQKYHDDLVYTYIMTKASRERLAKSEAALFGEIVRLESEGRLLCSRYTVDVKQRENITIKDEKVRELLSSESCPDVNFNIELFKPSYKLRKKEYSFLLESEPEYCTEVLSEVITVKHGKPVLTIKEEIDKEEGVLEGVLPGVGGTEPIGVRFREDGIGVENEND